MSSIMSSPHTQDEQAKTAKKACDQCHAQKLRCSGVLPCTRCVKNSRACTSRMVRKRKGPTPRIRFIRDESGHRSPRRSDSRTISGSTLDFLDPPRGESSIPMNDVTFLQDDGWNIPLPTEQDNGEIDWTAGLPNGFDISNLFGSSQTLNDLNSTDIPIQTPYFDTSSPSGLLAQFDPDASSSSSFPQLPDPYQHRICENPSICSSSLLPPPPSLSNDFDSSRFSLLLLAETLFRPQVTVYFDRINPMMPVLEDQAILPHLSDMRWLGARENQALVLVITGLALVHPFTTEEKAHKADREKHALMLLDQACHLIAAWDYGCFGTVEKAMTYFLMFGILHEVGQTWGARMRLRDAITMAESMGLNQKGAYADLSPWEAKRRLRLFYILALTERAYALQRSPGGSLSFDGRISGFAQAVLTAGPSNETDDPITISLQHLSHLFSHIDKDLIPCWNRTCSPNSCTALDRQTASAVLLKLHGTADTVFSAHGGLGALNEAQRADLLVTWQWIKSRLWLLASLHGYTSECGPVELSSAYVVDIAILLVDICNGLSFGSMECHGTGFVEKLYDVAHLAASSLTSLANQTSMPGFEALAAPSWGMINPAFDACQTLQLYVARHHRGKNELAPRLQNAITEARMAHQLAVIV